MERKISVIENLDGKKTVVIQDIIFKGRQSINWDDVERYLKKYINEVYEVAETGDRIFIGSDLPSLMVPILTKATRLCIVSLQQSLARLHLLSVKTC